MTAILDYIQMPGFDFYTTDASTPIYVKKIKQDIKECVCCGYDYTTDELSGFNTYTKCDKVVNGAYLCPDHEEIDLNVINERNKLNIVLDNNYNVLVEGFDADNVHEIILIDYYYIDNRLNNSIYLRKNGTKNIAQKYRQYKKCTYTVNLNKNYMIIKFWDSRNRLILKALKYINISSGLQNILDIFNLFHDLQVVNLLTLYIEPIYLVYKNISRIKLESKLLKEIANKVVDNIYLNIDAKLLKSYIANFVAFRDNNTQKENYRYMLFKFLIHQYKNIIKLYKKPELSEIFKVLYKKIEENLNFFKEHNMPVVEQDEIECNVIKDEIVRFFQLNIYDEEVC